MKNLFRDVILIIFTAIVGLSSIWLSQFIFVSNKNTTEGTTKSEVSSQTEKDKIPESSLPSKIKSKIDPQETQKSFEIDEKEQSQEQMQININEKVQAEVDRVTRELEAKHQRELSEIKKEMKELENDQKTAISTEKTAINEQPNKTHAANRQNKPINEIETPKSQAPKKHPPLSANSKEKNVSPNNTSSSSSKQDDPADKQTKLKDICPPEDRRTRKCNLPKALN